jgi:uncharacterized protein
MKGFHRVILIALRLLVAVLVAAPAAHLAAQQVQSLPKPTDYVSDNAGVLSPGAIARIDNLCSQLDHSKANAQVAVVTVHNLNGDDAADYANQLEDKWKIGRKGSDKGVLILLAVDDHKYRIDVGYGLEGILPDAKVGDIGRAMVPYLRGADYDNALTQTVSAVGQVIAADAQVTLEDEPAQETQPVAHERRSPAFGRILLLLFLLIFFGGSWLFRMLLGFGLFSSIFGGGYRGGGGFGGGGFGGGGGGGDGGGFGGFGGGGFGGGGAGGSW